VIGTGESAARLEVLRHEPRLTIVHHADERGCWASRGRQILFQGAPEEPWRPLARFPRARPLDRLAPLRLASRALRIDRCNLYPTRAGGLLGIRAGTVYRIEGGRLAALGKIRGACLLNRAIGETGEGTLYFGEYLTNAGRGPIRVWRIAPDLSRMEAVHTFEGIRHVHAIQSDPFQPGRLWITMGDFDGECFLYFTDDGFRTLERLGDGGQRFRTVNLVFGPERLAWLTDSELDQNYAVSMDRATGAVTLHGEVASSCWYTARTSDGVLLATTTVEPGPAIRTRRACVLHSRDGIRWSEAASFAKDRWPMGFFKYGTLSLPSGSFSSRHFWISGEALVGLDGGSLLCALSAGGEAG